MKTWWSNFRRLHLCTRGRHRIEEMGSPAVVNLGVCIDCATIHKIVHTERAIWLLMED